MHKTTETDPYYEERLKKTIEKFKKWCFNNPSCVGKGVAKIAHI